MDAGRVNVPLNLAVDGEPLRLGQILDQLFAYAGMLSPEGIVLDVNHAALRDAELAHEDVVGAAFWQTPWWSYDTAVQEMIRDAVSGAAAGRTIRFDARARMRAGRLVPLDVQIAPLRDADGAIVLLVASATDLSQREAATAALEASERRAQRRLAELELIYNEAPVGLGMVDRDLRFIRVNQQLADMNGTSAAAHEAQRVGNVVPGLRSQLEPVLRRVLATGEPVLGVDIGGETPSRPGVARHWIQHFYPLFGSGERVDAVGIICEETTGRKFAERQAEAHRRELEHLALHDPLTQLPNRALLADRARQAMAQAKRDGTQAALLMLDLDDFKAVNDSLGHAAGDALLQHVAERLRATLRDVDTVGRLGGDEFAVITGALADAEAPAAVAERVLAALAEPMDLMGRRHVVSASIGVAVFPQDAPRLGGLFRCADLALYESKDRGRACATFFEPAMRERLRERQQLERSLKRAVDDADFHLELRPRHAVADDRLIALELQPLWRHPQLGLVPVEEHLVFAERKGLARPLAEWTIARLETILVELRRETSELRLCLALSPTQLQNATVIDGLLAALERADTPGDRLQVEVLTGKAWSLQTDPLRAALERLAAEGVSIGLRGLGADHVAFHELRRLPLDSLVLEADLVRALDEAPEADAFVEAFAGLGRRLGKRVVACGVETRAQLELLRASGCEEAQGPFFAHGRAGETARAARPAR